MRSRNDQGRAPAAQELEHIAVLMDEGLYEDNVTEEDRSKHAEPRKREVAQRLAVVAAALQETGLADAGFRIGLPTEIPCEHEYGRDASGITPETVERLQLARQALRDHLGPARLAGAPAARIVLDDHASIDLFGDKYVGKAEHLIWRYQLR